MEQKRRSSTKSTITKIEVIGNNLYGQLVLNNDKCYLEYYSSGERKEFTPNDSGVFVGKNGSIANNAITSVSADDSTWTQIIFHCTETTSNYNLSSTSVKAAWRANSNNADFSAIALHPGNNLNI